MPDTVAGNTDVDVARIAQARWRMLLERLGGAAAYEESRRRLILILRVHVPARAEELADAALERLARRLEQGAEVERPAAFALGIARKLVLEAEADAARQARLQADPTVQPEQEVDADEAATAQRALQVCLERLDVPERRLILAYYGADGAARIAARKRMAAERGVSVNALRNRALRLRETLQRCLQRRFGMTSGKSA